MVFTPGNGIEVAVASSVDDELIAAFSRLIPQLSRGAAVPTPDLIREIVRGSGQHGGDRARPPRQWRIVGMLTLIVFRIPTGVRAWIEDVVVDVNNERAWCGRSVEVRRRSVVQLARALGRRRSHISTLPRGGQPTLSAVRIYPARQQCVPLHPVTARLEALPRGGA
jgi:hypothetical protein